MLFCVANKINMTNYFNTYRECAEIMGDGKIVDCQQAISDGCRKCCREGGFLLPGEELAIVPDGVVITNRMVRDCLDSDGCKFATHTFGEILSEARKYRLNLCVSHQHLGQLDDYTKSMVFGNVGSMISFRVGAEDAFNLEREFTPVLKANDIINLGVREFYVKMTIDGKLRDPFSGYTLSVPKVTNDLSPQIIENSRKTYGMPKDEVSKLIEAMDKGDGATYTPEAGTANSLGEEKFSAPLVKKPLIM